MRGNRFTPPKKTSVEFVGDELQFYRHTSSVDSIKTAPDGCFLNAEEAMLVGS